MADAQLQSMQPSPVVNKPITDHIHVMVRNRTQILFEGDVESLTSINDTGTFDVLPQHANFISLIKTQLILRPRGGEKKEISFTTGILKVKDTTVHCYIDLLATENR
jgi:F0F1-type ATP synthase epsilon subunit